MEPYSLDIERLGAAGHPGRVAFLLPVLDTCGVYACTPGLTIGRSMRIPRAIKTAHIRPVREADADSAADRMRLLGRLPGHASHHA